MNSNSNNDGLSIEFIPGEEVEERYVVWNDNKYRRNKAPYKCKDESISNYWKCCGLNGQCKAQIITKEKDGEHKLSPTCKPPKHDHDEDNYGDIERLKEWCAQRLVQLANLHDGKVTVAWKEFKIECSAQSLVFKDFAEVESYVRRHKNQTYPKLPKSVDEAFTVAQSTNFGTSAWEQKISEEDCLTSTEFQKAKSEIESMKNDVAGLQNMLKNVDQDLLEKQSIRRAIRTAIVQSDKLAADFFLKSCVLGRTEDKQNIIFGDEKSLKRLADSEQWGLDGTFPKVTISSNADKQIPWKQVIQIHTLIPSNDLERRSKTFASIFILTKDKNETTYVDIFTRLKEIASSNPESIELSPQFVCCDFEKGFINALQKVFTGVQITGCFFHFVQANVKQIGKKKLKKLYQADGEWKYAVRLLWYSAFLPEQKISDFCEQQLQHIQRITQTEHKEYKVRALDYITYFRNTWLNQLPPKLWCVFGQQDRTNNLLERSNKEMHRAITKKPLYWDFIRYVCRTLSDALLEHRRALKHQRHPKKPLLQQNRDKMLMKIMHNFNENTDILTYLSLIKQACVGTMEDFHSGILQSQLEEIEQNKIEDSNDESKEDDGNNNNNNNNNRNNNNAFKMYQSKLFEDVQDDVSNANKLNELVKEIKTSGIWNQCIRTQYNQNEKITKLKSNANKYNGSLGQIENAIVLVKYLYVDANNRNKQHYKPGVIVCCEDTACLIIYPCDDECVVITDCVKSIKDGDIYVIS